MSARVGRRLAVRAPASSAQSVQGEVSEGASTALSDITVVADDLRTRNRRVVRILLAIMGTLALAGVLVGIRW